MAEFFQHGISTLGHGFVGYIVPFLFVLTIVVFFHELGHFLMHRTVTMARTRDDGDKIFCDAEWQADPKFEPFKRTARSTDRYDGAFAWHWHNRWDDRIQNGSKFQRLEAEMDARLAAMGFAPGPSEATHGG